MSWGGRCAFLVCAMITTAVVVGCEKGVAPPAFAEGKAIADFSLTISLRDGSGAEEYYNIDRDGTFGFGGGMDARFERIAWSTQLNAEEMQTLQNLVLAQGWLEPGLSSTKSPPNARCQIDMRLAEQSLHKTIKGEHPRIEPVRVALRDIANRRLKPDLERQPRPSIATQPAPAATRPP